MQTGTGWSKKVSRRVQAARADLRVGGGVKGNHFGPSFLAGVVVIAGFAGRCVGRRPSRTCALWARLSEGPVQTDTGWSKKVSRRVQAARAYRRMTDRSTTITQLEFYPWEASNMLCGPVDAAVEALVEGIEWLERMYRAVMHGARHRS